MSEAVGLKELLRRKIEEMNANPPCFGEFRFGTAYSERECNTCPSIDPCMEQTAKRLRAKETAHLSSDDLHVPGAKDDKAKPIAGELVLGFPRALEALVAVATYGANKYSRGGYLHVNNFDVRYLDAAMRHLLSYGRGDKTDKESGLPHLAHCLWNIAAILEMETRHEESSGS